MKRPSNPQELLEFHRLLHTDPQHYLKVTNEWIDETPNDPDPYFDRHYVWLELDEPEKSLQDMNTVIGLQPTQMDFWVRGNVYRHLGDFANAAEDYARAEQLVPQEWEEAAHPLLYQADVHAALGNVAAALDCCNRLPDDFWTPGAFGLPPGNKAEIADELKRRAAAAIAARRSE